MSDYKDRFDEITAEIELFGLKYDWSLPKNDKNQYIYDFVNFRVWVGTLFFDFTTFFDKDELRVYYQTHKRLVDKSETVCYPLTMANIDELLLAISSYNNVYIPKLCK